MHHLRPSLDEQIAKEAKLVQKITRQRALIAEMRAVLKGLEYVDHYTGHRCPECYHPFGHSHHPDCNLRDLLDRTEGYGGEDE